MLQAEADRFCASAAPLLEADPEHAVQGIRPTVTPLPSSGRSRSRVTRRELAGGARRSGALVARDHRPRGAPRVRLAAALRVPRVGQDVGHALVHFGFDELRATLVPQIAAGRLIFCQGFSEPEAGSDLAGLRTRARRCADRFIVNGHKIWTSNAHISDWIYLAVRTSPPTSKRHDGISVLVAPIESPGISVRTFPTMGGGYLSEVFLEDVEVPRASTSSARSTTAGTS